MRNVALLEQTMQYILDHPESHDQGWWFSREECGTAACFAGWAWMLAGQEPPKELLEFRGGGRVPTSLEVATFRNSAAKLLGLTYDEADALFNAGNDVSELQLMVKDLVNGDNLAIYAGMDD